MEWPAWSARHYARLLQEPVYRQVFSQTALLSAAVTVLTLVLGYPLAFVLSRARPRLRRLMLLVVAVPFWTSVLVRSYAWLVLLQQQGAVNQALIGLGIVEQPIQLVYNGIGVILGMTYVLLPFMVLVIFAALRRIDSTLLIAASTLGANRATIFWRIVLPLSWPGIAAGVMLVFILGLGFFVTPALLGGLRQITVGMVIDVQMNRLLDWAFGSALALSLVGIVLTLASLAYRSQDIRRLAGREI